MDKQRPVVSVSFADLRQLGFEIEVSEHTKNLASGKESISVKIESIKKSGSVIPRAEMTELLFYLGLNTRKGGRWWVDYKKLHRPILSNRKVIDYRFVGEERLDKDWLASGRASTEAHVFSSRMSDMGRTLSKMERGGDE